MVPEPSNGLLCNRIVVVPAAVVSEHRELLFLHHISRRLGLDPTPDISNVSFKHLSDGWRDLSILIVFGDLESICHRQLVRSLATHCGMSETVKGIIKIEMSAELAKKEERRTRRRTGN